MENKLVNWLAEEIKNRGWSQSELARRSPGVSRSIISLVMSGKQSPTFDFCVGIAKATSEQPEKLFRLAGLLPQLRHPGLDAKTKREWFYVMKNLSPRLRE